MNYHDAINWLEGLQKFPEASKFERILKMLGELGNPEAGLKVVHVGGTNGKGSTCAMVASILKEGGIKAGLFTSPHLFKYNERVKVGGVDISDEEFVEYLERVKSVAEGADLEPSLFEVLFVMSLKYFQDKEVEVAVVEVGMGGRLDPTNAIKSDMAIITNIDLDHTHILGTEKKEIAKEKAGIIKKGGVCITTETDENLIRIFADRAKDVGVKLFVLEPNDIDLINQSVKGQVFNFMKYMNLELPLLGGHQLFNAALAITCCELLNMDENAIRTGLRRVEWPIRLEVVHHEPTVVIDGAHTEHATKFAIKTINQIWEDKRKILILGFSEGKKWKEMVDILINQVDIIIVTKARYNGISEDLLFKYIEGKKGGERYKAENADLAVKKAMEIAENEDLVIVLGGLYLGAEVKMAL